jgi:hypothetical protein
MIATDADPYTRLLSRLRDVADDLAEAGQDAVAFGALVARDMGRSNAHLPTAQLGSFANRDQKPGEGITLVPQFATAQF